MCHTQTGRNVNNNQNYCYDHCYLFINLFILLYWLSMVTKGQFQLTRGFEKSRTYLLQQRQRLAAFLRTFVEDQSNQRLCLLCHFRILLHYLMHFHETQDLRLFKTVHQLM